jgi:flagellar biosynthetic protein FlhB
VRGADILITNPTHFAIGLRYDPRTMAAPKVVAMGSDKLALRLKRLAFLYGVTVVEKRLLARALFLKGRMNKPIPEVLFRPVADVYLAVQAQAKRQEALGVRHV